MHLQYTDPATGTMRYTLWVSKPDGATLGKVYSAGSAAGPFTEVPNSNSTGCYINPSPLRVNGSFYCTGQKGTTIMTAKAIGGPWTAFANISHRGEDPFIWVDARQNWHALFRGNNQLAQLPARLPRHNNNAMHWPSGKLCPGAQCHASLCSLHL